MPQAHVVLLVGLTAFTVARFVQWSPLRLLGALALVDVGFIVLHVIVRLLEIPSDSVLYIDRDGGYGETFQYVKEGLIATVLMTVYLRTRQTVFVGWTAMFAYLLADDALEIHETVGLWLGDFLRLPSVFGLQADDLGELIFAAGVGGVFLLILIVGYRYADPTARQVSHLLGVLVLLLAFVGVGVDVLHSAATNGHVRYVAFTLDMIEDGGEMLVMSLIVSYVRYLLSSVPRTVPAPRPAPALATRDVTAPVAAALVVAPANGHCRSGRAPVHGPRHGCVVSGEPAPAPSPPSSPRAAAPDPAPSRTAAAG